MPRRPAASVPLQLAGSVTQQLAQLAEAVNRKADQVGEPMFNAVLLAAPGGATWRVWIDDAGTLHADAVPRT